MIDQSTPITFQDALPEAVDAVIIGGGVIGVFSALYMTRAGLRVLLCEKGRISGEQSSRNWGWIRKQGRDADEVPVAIKALELWRAVDRELSGKTGFVEQGVTYLASTDKEEADLVNWLDVAKAYDLDTRLLSAKELEDVINPDTAGRGHAWKGAIHTPSDARAEPWLAVPAVAQLAQSEGALIVEDCAVRTLETAAGKVTGVVTEKGPVRAEQVVVAGGAWSSLFLRNQGIRMPQLAMFSTVSATTQLPAFLTGNAADGQLGIRRRNDGGYTLCAHRRSRHLIGPDSFRHVGAFLPVIRRSWSEYGYGLAPRHGSPFAWRTKKQWAADEVSPFERTRVLNPAPDMKSVERARTLFAERFPACGKPEIARAWAGMVDVMPDVVPVVDKIDQVPGLIVATGMSGHGFGIGPGFASIVADLAAGRAPEEDIHRFRFSRFTDGSRLQLGPGL